MLHCQGRQPLLDTSLRPETLKYTHNVDLQQHILQLVEKHVTFVLHLHTKIYVQATRFAVLVALAK